MSYPPPHNPRDGGLAGATLRTLTTAPREVWVALAALLAFNVSLRLVAGRLGIAVDDFSVKPGYIAYVVIEGLAAAACVGLVMHSLLTGHPPPRLGRGFLGFVGFTGGVSLLSTALVAFVFASSVGASGGASAGAGAEGVALRFGVVAVGLVGGIFVFVRLLLLPIGWLVGERGLTPSVAWGRMRGQVTAYIGATIILSLPITLMVMLVAGAAGAAEGAPLSPPVMILGEALVILYVAVTAALNAVMYLRRAGDPQQRLSEVFD